MALTPLTDQVTWLRATGVPSVTEVTLMRWVRVDADADYHNFFQIGHADALNFLWVGTDIDGVTPAVEVFDDPDDVYELAVADPIAPDEWWHVAIVKDGNDYELFLSNESGTYDATSVLTFSTANLESPNELRCYIDPGDGATNFKAFTAALTAPQIRLERDRFKHTSSAVNCVHPMDSAAATQPGMAQDVSGNGRHLLAASGTATLAGPAILTYGTAGFCRRGQGAVATGTVSLSVEVPTAAVAGDLLLLSLVHKGAGYATVPAGWTLLGQGLSGSTRGEVYWKRHSFVGTAYAAEGATVSVTDLADTAQGVIIAYDGVEHVGDPVEVVLVQQNASGTHGTVIIPDPGERHLLVVAMCAKGANLSTGPPNGVIASTDRSGYDPSFNSSPSLVNATSTTGTDCTLGVGEFVKHFRGDIPRINWSGSAAAENVSITFALRSETQPFARRFYFASLPPRTRVTGDLSFPWDHHSWGPGGYQQNHWSLRFTPRKDMAGAMATRTLTSNEEEKNVLNTHGLLPLRAQVLPDAVVLTLTNYVKGTYQDASTATYPDGTMSTRFRMGASLTEGESLEPYANLFPADISATDFLNTRRWRSHAVALGPLTILEDDDCFSLEHGFRFVSMPTPEPDYRTPTAWGYIEFYYGAGNSTGTVPTGVAFDGVDGTTTSGRAPFIEFDQLLLLAEEHDPPPHDDYANRIVLPGSGEPQTDGPVDVSGGAGIAGSVWYQFTPAASARFIFHCLGSNYGCDISVWTGSPHAVVVDATTDTDFSGVAGSLACWVGDLVAETTYFVQVMMRAASMVDGPGELYFEVCPWRSPEPDDYYYPNSGYVLVYRETQLIGITPNLGQVISGVAIDYTQREMDDLNGGTHADYRLLVGSFENGLVEILDLETLSVDGSEIDYISDGAGEALNPDQNRNISTLEVNEAGELFVGYFGAFGLVEGFEHTYENGPGQTPAYHAVQQTDAIYGSNQSGMPWPTATQHLVEFDEGGSNYIRLDGDGKLLYSSSGQYIGVGGTRILKFDPMASTQEDDFAAYGAGGGANPGGKGICVLPDGGLLLCNGNRVERYSRSGAFVRSYRPAPSTHATTLADVDLTNDGLYFIVMDSGTGSFFKIKLSSGVQSWHNWTHSGVGNSTSFVVFRPDRFLPICEADVATKLQTLNLALLRIGVNRLIQALDEDSVEATVGNYIFDFEMKATLRAFPWPFATKYADAADEVDGYMSLVTGTESDPVNKDWTYAYAYPPDCLFARRLVTEGTGREFDPNPKPFRVGRLYNEASDPDDDQIVVFSNEPDAVLEYTAFIECGEMFADQLFISALAWRLASIMAPSMSRVPDMEKRAIVMFERALTTAAAVAAKEHQPTANGEAESIRARE